MRSTVMWDHSETSRLVSRRSTCSIAGSLISSSPKGRELTTTRLESSRQHSRSSRSAPCTWTWSPMWMIQTSTRLKHAGSLAPSCAIIVQFEDPDLRSAAAHLARWAPRTAAQIRSYLAGSLTRPAFERAISRRPWPDHHRAALKRLSGERLATVAEGLEVNDFSKVLRAFA